MPPMGGGPPRRTPGGPPTYKVLCVSALHPKASDDVVRDTLYREYKKYGDISVRVMQEPDERVAYVYFRNFEDARDAKHSKSRIILFDKPALVEPVYERGSQGPVSPGLQGRLPPPAERLPPEGLVSGSAHGRQGPHGRGRGRIRRSGWWWIRGWGWWLRRSEEG